MTCKFLIDQGAEREARLYTTSRSVTLNALPTCLKFTLHSTPFDLLIRNASYHRHCDPENMQNAAQLLLYGSKISAWRFSTFRGSREHFSLLQERFCPHYYRTSFSTRARIAMDLTKWPLENSPDLFERVLSPTALDKSSYNYVDKKGNCFLNAIARAVGEISSWTCYFAKHARHHLERDQIERKYSMT